MGIWGNQLIQDYGFRLYNPAIGKFLSVDPLSPEYPELTPYQFASNTPIEAIDLDGLEALHINNGQIGVSEDAKFDGYVTEYETFGNGFTTGHKMTWTTAKLKYNVNRDKIGSRLYDRYEGTEMEAAPAPEGSLESIAFTTQFWFSALSGQANFKWKGGIVDLTPGVSKGIIQQSLHQNGKDMIAVQKVGVALGLTYLTGGFALSTRSIGLRSVNAMSYNSMALDAGYQFWTTGNINLGQSFGAGLFKNPAAAVTFGQIYNVSIGNDGFSYGQFDMNKAGSSVIGASFFGPLGNTFGSNFSKFAKDKGSQIMGNYGMPILLGNLCADIFGLEYIGNYPNKPMFNSKAPFNVKK